MLSFFRERDRCQYEIPATKSQLKHFFGSTYEVQDVKQDLMNQHRIVKLDKTHITGVAWTSNVYLELYIRDNEVYGSRCTAYGEVVKTPVIMKTGSRTFKVLEKQSIVATNSPGWWQRWISWTTMPTSRESKVVCETSEDDSLNVNALFDAGLLALIVAVVSYDVLSYLYRRRRRK
mmetsp:Transcript_14736/g.22220  ORF Transcript_14736/g.22220 Transcript_14736/m.22220 type:complete len:176 (+) Transcript_14736:97-624(+)